MNISLAHKIEMKPNNVQAGYLKKACGVSRFTFNWGLAEWKRQFEEGLKPSGLSLKKEFNAIKEDQYPWVYEVTKCAPEQAFTNLQTSFTRFFKGESAYPCFKKKGVDDSFYISIQA